MTQPKDLRSIIDEHWQDNITPEVALMLDHLIRENFAIKAMFCYMMKFATHQALEVSNFNMAQDHAVATVSKLQGRAGGVRDLVEFIISKCEEATAPKPEPTKKEEPSEEE